MVAGTDKNESRQICLSIGGFLCSPYIILFYSFKYSFGKIAFISDDL